MSEHLEQQSRRGAELVVDTLINEGVKHVFAIPGAKIDAVFDALVDRGPELVVVRHEQNAAFMAQAVGRLTGKPGVALVTSGPGVSNLATGLITANSEGDPVVAIGGQVKRSDLLKQTHQSMDNVSLLRPVTKSAVEVGHQDSISEAITNAFRKAKEPKKGATFVSLPADVISEKTSVKAIKRLREPILGIADPKHVSDLVEKIENAELPVLLLGMNASTKEATEAIRLLVAKTGIPVVEMLQAAGVISRGLVQHFYGRVGLFRNQPGDRLLHKADLIISIGYDPIEYDPVYWNTNKNATLVHIDDTIAVIDRDYQPDIELIGDISETLKCIYNGNPKVRISEENLAYLKELQEEIVKRDEPPKSKIEGRLHPLEIIQQTQNAVSDDTIVTCDIGSHGIWLARHFRSYEPRHLLFSNGMQTLGVALPWAIASGLLYPNKKTLSISGDGGFLFSAMELETAVRLKSPIVHVVWNDSSYNMVAFQQEMKYGRDSAVHLGQVDIKKHAESYGAVGMRATTKEEFAKCLEEAFKIEGPVVIDVPVDYSDNIKLGETLQDSYIN